MTPIISFELSRKLQGRCRLRKLLAGRGPCSYKTAIGEVTKADTVTSAMSNFEVALRTIREMFLPSEPGMRSDAFLLYMC